MKRLLAVAVLFAAFAVHAQNVVTLTPATPTLDPSPNVYSGSTKILDNATDAAACAAEIKRHAALRVPGSYTYSCRLSITSVTAVVTAPVVTCGAKPANETRAQTCPAGTTGSWSQVRTYNSVPAPTCWVAGEWLPTTAPDGACVTTPPPPPSTKFVIGQAVACAADGCNVRGTPAGALLGTQSSNTLGTVTGGPVAATFNNLPVIWWTVDFASGADGWVSEERLQVPVAPPPPPCTSPQPAAQVRTQACPSGTTGSWTQTNAYVAAPAPACWVESTWLPTTAPTGTCVAIPPGSGTATLSWDVSPAPATGYRVYWGTAPRTYTQAKGTGVVVTGPPTYIVGGLSAGAKYFAVTAFDAAGNESDYSNEVSKVIP